MTTHVWTLDGWTLYEGPTPAGHTGPLAHLDEVRGWYGSPKPRSSSPPRARGHGRFPADLWRDARQVELLGTLEAASQPELAEAIRGLAAVCSAPGLHELRCDDGTLPLLAHVQLADDVAIQPAGNWHAVFTIAVEAPDPLRYGPPLTMSTGLPTAGGGLGYPLAYPLDYGPVGAPGRLVLANQGTADSPIAFDVTGPLPSGFELSALGRRIRYEAEVPAGQVITVDTATGSVVAEGTADRRGNVTVADWLLVPPRSQLAVQFTSLGGFDAAARAAARWRAAYW